MNQQIKCIENCSTGPIIWGSMHHMRNLSFDTDSEANTLRREVDFTQEMLSAIFLQSRNNHLRCSL